MAHMALIKVRAPPRLERAFRKAASTRIGVRRGAVKDAVLAALSKYAGIDPEVSLSVSSASVSVEAPPSIMPRVLGKILPTGEIRVSAYQDRKEILEKIAKVKVLDLEEGYTHFEWHKPDASKLSELGSFRAEWDGQELVFVEDCLNVTVTSLEEALKLARSLTPTLGLVFPEEKVTERLDIYKWEGASAQETIAA